MVRAEDLCRDSGQSREPDSRLQLTQSKHESVQIVSEETLLTSTCNEVGRMFPSTKRLSEYLWILVSSCILICCVSALYLRAHVERWTDDTTYDTPLPTGKKQLTIDPYAGAWMPELVKDFSDREASKE